jgi:FkbM family methyltransferase
MTSAETDKTAGLNLLLYRMYIVLKTSVANGRLRRWPGAKKGLEQFKGLIRRRFLRKTQAWVQIQSGLSQGMWMQIAIPGEGFLWRGEHEPEVQMAISAALRPGAVFYDVGAHVGIMTLGAARLVGPAGRVVAFDGDPENIQRLRANTAKNGLEDRLQVVHTAIWSRTVAGGISFRRGASARSQGGVEADGTRPVLATGEIVNVPAITLDDFVAAGGPLPQLIKIDVEGGEYEVLRGAAKIFATQRPFIVAEIHHQEAAEQIVSWLNQCRYAAKWKIPDEQFPRRLFAWPAEKDGEAWVREAWVREAGARGASSSTH